MIFVILGTQDKKFPRLLHAVEELILDGTIKKKVVVQAGTTPYSSKVMEIHSTMSPNQFLKYVEQSDYIITHGGVGTILDALKKKKKVIAVPRLKAYKEHENDHQLQIIEKFSSEHYILGCHTVEELKDAVMQIEAFEPEPCLVNNEQMISLISSYIDNTSNPRKEIMIFVFYAVCALVLQIGFYYLGQMWQPNQNCMWFSWLISYIGLIGLTYQKKHYGFETIWGVLLTFGMWIWFTLYNEQALMMIVTTIIADLLTYIGHAMFYRKNKK